MSGLTFTLRRGLHLALPGAPAAGIDPGRPPREVAVLGADFPGVRPRLVVAQGDRVRRGAPLFTGRRHRAIRAVAPASGVVSRIVTGEQGRPRVIAIAAEGDEEETFAVPPYAAIASTPPERIEELLLLSGLWTRLRTRPFDHVPVPGTRPAHLFVTALDSNPLAPPPPAVLDGRGREFGLGLDALARLTSGRVYLCQGPGPDLARPDSPRVVVARFDGPHPAGLPGTHIHLLAPVDMQRTVWHVGYQDVVALGSLLVTGAVPCERVISLAGPGVRRPRLLRTRIGAGLAELLRDELDGADGPASRRVIAGSVFAGRVVGAQTAYLGARELQVNVLPARGAPGWTPAPVARPRPFVPVPAFDRVLALDVPAAALLRALLLEDDDAAVELGALELAEEDLALLSFVCPARHDYGTLLRACLSRIQEMQRA